MEEIDEPEHLPNPPSGKKGRHRKRQLFHTILQQMEFYFSDSNLTKDRFLANLIKEDPYVDLSIFLKFNKIRALTDNVNTIARALKKSTFLKLSEDKTKVCRTTPIQQKDNIDDCTIYVERIPTDMTHDGLSKIFSQFGQVQYISIPKYKHNKMIKGFAFVEFDTPEAAQKTLDYFASIGCKLPTQMPPDKLYSIVTYNPNEENNDEKTENNSDKTTESTTNPPESTDQNTDNSNNTNSQQDIKTESNDKCDIEEKIDEPETEVQKLKKRTLSQTECTDQNDENKAKKVKTDDDNNKDESKEETNTETVEENVPENGTDQNNEKRRRRRKKKSRIGIDIKEIGLQVLSKREWKRLRNKYLDLQRAKMKSLKLQLYRARFSNPNNQQTMQREQCNGNDQDQTDKTSQDKTKREKIFTIDEGTVVHMQLPDPCIDLKNFKAELKTFSNDVKYIDISEGSFEAYVRFTNREAAKKFVECSYPATMQILDGETHNQYLEKAQQDRINKFQKTAAKPKNRGRDKLLKKAEKELGIHIRFEDTE